MDISDSDPIASTASPPPQPSPLLDRHPATNDSTAQPPAIPSAMADDASPPPTGSLKRLRQSSNSTTEADRVADTASSENDGIPPDEADDDDVDDALENAVNEWDSGQTETETEAGESSDVPMIEPAEQEAYIGRLASAPLKEGETWYLVAEHWKKRWEMYCNRMKSASEQTRALGKNAAPGPVDNAPLLSNGQLKPNLLMEEYWVVPEKAWLCFTKW